MPPALVVISRPTSTAVYSNLTSTCYSSLKNVPNDTANFLVLSRPCSPNDVAIKYSFSAVGCNDTQPEFFAELNTVDFSGSIITCYQSPTASPRDPTSYVVLHYSSDSSCSELGAAVSFENVVGKCQTVLGHTIMITETCYENDPFVRLSSFSNAGCTELVYNSTLRQGRDRCNFGGQFPSRAYCIQPITQNRPANDPLSDLQAKIVLSTRRVTQNSTLLLPNGPLVTSLSCLPVDDGAGSIPFYAKLIDGRCSEQDEVTRIAFFTDSSCSALSKYHALKVGANHSNVMDGLIYTVECFTAGEMVQSRRCSPLATLITAAQPVSLQLALSP